ncbi:hypothetical protein V493_00393 [Pseudogymnoascus sp. VKM F-4281 (FW-2241)]|nr:hypothetical protein V493_00393 [Pseudogymnoascus sp. VKM F-4281 (FW-2241)]
MVQPIKLYTVAAGPNPWKVAIFLEELGIPYTNEVKTFAELKEEPYLDINPNGRVPAIQDTNTGFTISESGAILQYLAETYDTTNKFHHASGEEKYAEYQWLHFQTSGQGPYFGQKAWFSNYHAEKLPSAEARYEGEIRRVLGVVELHLSKAKTDYLVGNTYSYADLAWTTWNQLIGWLAADINVKNDFPLFAAWDEKIQSRPSVIKIAADKAKLSE